jgi:ABC-type uncharacterized transport system substrate-binding protein
MGGFWPQPPAIRLAVLLNPANPSAAIAVSHMQRTADALGVELIPMEVKSRDEIAAAIMTMTKRGAFAFVGGLNGPRPAE